MFGNHKIVVLEFSGGRDSLATLYFMRAYWNDLTVLWLNTGDAFPETLKQMQQIKALVPNFMEVCSNQPQQIMLNGYPSDVVPVWDTALGRSFHAGRTHMSQSPLQCCHDNLWVPMHDACREIGATLVIRGQRNAEKLKSSIRSGHVEDGVEYLFPLEDWTDEQVDEFLRAEGVALPENYAFMATSLDCQHCTAYLAENHGKFVYMRQHHPGLYRENVRRLAQNVVAQSQEQAHALTIIAASME